MRIAFFTYDYPPNIIQGGIATYTEQIARLLAQEGCEVEVFCQSFTENTLERPLQGLVVHRLASKDATDYFAISVEFFKERHAASPFDLVESPEIHPSILAVKTLIPRPVLLVRLHTPTRMIVQLNMHYKPLLSKLRYIAGNLLRGQWRKLIKPYKKESDPQYLLAQAADALSAPSTSMKEKIVELWKVAPEKINVVSNPFSIDPAYFDIPIRKTQSYQVTFTGKINIHKGMVALTYAIPRVLEKIPQARFTLVGEIWSFHGQESMKEWMCNRLKPFLSQIEFTGKIEYTEIPGYLAQADVCIFPSIYEAFGYTCIEAMAAGRAVVGSGEGAMKELLAEGAGRIVDPKKPRELAKAILDLLGDPDQRVQLGTQARDRVRTKYNPHQIAREMKALYQEKIAPQNLA